MDLTQAVGQLIEDTGPIAPDSIGKAKKNYTEALSAGITKLIRQEFLDQGLPGVLAPEGRRDKQFMGGYGPKGVDAYLSDEKHGLLLSSGTKGILFAVAKNLKNRYRDMAMEALELHKRFPFAICGHVVFLSRSESAQANKAFGTVLTEAGILLGGIDGRERPDEPAELYEGFGIMLLEPGEPDSVDLSPTGLPKALHAGTYVERMVAHFKRRNPFYVG